MVRVPVLSLLAHSKAVIFQFSNTLYKPDNIIKTVLLVAFIYLFFVQDLLQLQYEGVAVMKMFDKAKVNVNLLIFLLNKKFYGK